ncbi:tRNA glutamyl-Q(34) synthetase GluQRS [Hyphomicrobium sp. LHD-15]|uniref:tRNA glutamyl-Q(34) synthetase GluQRS n=1 Tax=Hyphomicrobium sp. LHD-15 TaxID=3072142 RepID=UPI00280F99BB|nr:tRNA glutamyl-Q(34) synthetase GluQRS [Hyphomicrobium sp. LHD-15]MDQ8698917.1 tRNA glutamyl-Q(34) synthetase GluQRS [Hyphomicrobium sp. LHD-15]
MSARPVLRFAPSPNGELHLGHALSALIGFDMAEKLGGRFLLRIEDIDTTRCREEYITHIYEDLAWLGITWEEPVLRQSLHFTTYSAASDWLLKLGLLYPCFATRAEIGEATELFPDAVDPDGAPLYPGLHKHLPKEEIAVRLARNEPFALRLHMDRAIDALEGITGTRHVTFTELDEHGNPQRIEINPADWGDAVIVRKDTPTSYHLAVVVDDGRQGVTHVTRGRDLYAATSLHRLLQTILGLPEPVYHHHRLLTDTDGRKLSKSARDTGLRELRAAGIDALQIRHRLGLPIPATPAQENHP